VNPDRFKRVMALFEEILELPAGERTARLTALCGDDGDLRREVESLLDQAGVDDGFLESGSPGEVLREHLESLGGETEQPPTAKKIPARIGPYRILGRLGLGGMGIVYEAEQENPRRRIALKILRTPFLSEQLRSRFERESEILGRLRHPGIAHIYEAGVADTSDGEPVPYYAMELVKGIPLTRYAENHALDARARLALMAKVCDAVEHAHGHGVIHRDLKPDNILVDERGEPRILDFGVARIVDREMAAHSMATATGLLIGTLPYMSPEQVGPRPDRIDARSDVYALGVIAFELLADRLPIDVAGVSIAEAARRIREEDAPHLGAVDRRYRGDVGTIVEKALHKQPRHRYASAAELGLDIRRHLADEPILARPPSGFYQLRKFAQRHRAIVAGVLVAFLALIAGTIVATRQALIAQEERATAVDLQHHAERQAYRAHIAAAATAVESHDMVLARGNLEAVSEALRAWEWRHLHSRLDQSSLAIEAGTAGKHTELRFGEGDGHIGVFASSTVPWVVFKVLLAGDTRPGERFPVGMSRPLLAPPDLLWQVTRSVHFARGESQVEVSDPSGVERAVLRRCGDASEAAYVRRLAPDGGHALLSTAGSVTARLCDLRSGKGGPSFPIPYAWAFALSADGSTVALSPKSDEGSSRVELYSTLNGARVGTLPVPSDDVTDLDLRADGKLVAAGSYNGVLRLWDVQTGLLLAERRGHGGQYIYAVSFSPDGARIATGSSDRTIHLWSADLSGAPGVLHGHTDDVVDVGFSSDGSRLASVDRSGSIRVFDLEDRLAEPEVLRGHGSYVNPVCHSPDGRLIVSGSWDGTVKVWEAATGNELVTLDLRSGVDAELGVTGLAIDTDGARLAVATTRAGVVLLDLVTGDILGSAHPGDRFSAVEFSPDGETLFAGTSWEDLLLLDSRTLEVVGREPFGLPFAWSPDGTRLLLRDSETSLSIRRGQRGPMIARLEPVDDDTSAVAWSPDSKRVVTASADGVVRVWDGWTGNPLGHLGTFTGGVHAARFHPDGTRIAIAGADGVIRLFDPVTREELVQLRGHEAYVFDLSWSPGGDTLVSASGDGTLRLWHTVPRRRRLEFRARWSDLRKEGARLVQDLLGEAGAAGAVAERLRGEAALDPGLRMAALTELLLHESR
jgi:WD40 repeat protein